MINVIEKTLVRIPWSSIKKIQSFRAIKSSYIWLFIVPIAAKSLSLITAPAHLTVFDYQFELNIGLPFSWQIFYFSAWCFFIGNVFYFFACPNLIKDHDSYASFRAAGKVRWQIKEYNEQIGVDLPERPERFQGFTYPSKPETAESEHAIEDEYVKNIFWTLFAKANHHNLIGRCLTSTVYAVGLFLIFWVLVENLVAVINLIFLNY